MSPEIETCPHFAGEAPRPEEFACGHTADE